MLCGGAPLTRANGYTNFSKCMQAWAVCTSIQLFFFPLENLLKLMGKPGNICEYLGSPKIFCAENPVSLRFWIFFGNKRMQTYANTIKDASLPYRRYTLFSKMYALQGVPIITLARSIPSIFQKWCTFRQPNPLRIHFSKKSIPQKKKIKHSQGS